jgi:hypothetical protein
VSEAEHDHTCPKCGDKTDTIIGDCDAGTEDHPGAYCYECTKSKDTRDYQDELADRIDDGYYDRKAHTGVCIDSPLGY